MGAEIGDDCKVVDCKPGLLQSLLQTLFIYSSWTTVADSFLMGWARHRSRHNIQTLKNYLNIVPESQVLDNVASYDFELTLFELLDQKYPDVVDC